MSPPEPGIEPIPPQPTPPPVRRTPAWLWGLLLIGLAGAAGWYGWRWVSAQLQRDHDQRELLVRLDADLQQLQGRVREMSKQQVELPGRVEKVESRVGQMAESVDGRAGLKLAAVEQLLLLANDHLLLANDARAARRALEEADRRLASLDDPSLLPVRELLTRERAELDAYPDTDRAGASLKLGEMIRQAPNWPLRARSPERSDATPAPEAPPAEQTWSQRFWTSITRALAGMFTVRRTQGPAPRLLPPGEEAMVAQALQLKLEGARLALLAGDAAAARELCTGASDWLHTYYDEANAQVASAQRQLVELAQSSGTVPRPDIGGSLARLRQITGRR